MLRKPYPINLSIGIHTYCNATCIFCPYGDISKKLPMGKMPFSLFEQIIVEYAELMKRYDFIGHVGFCFMSEPFVEKEIIKYTEFVLRHGINLNFTTNAALLTPQVVDQLVRINFTGKFKISCHGIKEETHRRVMGIPLTPVLENIDYLISRYPKEKIHVRAFPFGWEKGEKRQVKKYWKSRGVSLAGGVATSRAGLIGNLKISSHQKIYGCSWNRPLRYMVISYDGEVRLCCMDMSRETSMGNVAESGLHSVWNGAVFKHHLAQIYQGEFSEENFICKRCEWATTRFSRYKFSKIPRKIQRHFYKKKLEHLDLNQITKRS
jgi:radical SAM protein with 4Fe4S-binding SPASM domain